MFLVLSIGLIAMTAIQTFARGARCGLWWGWLIALLLMPTWIFVRMGALTVDLRTVAGSAGLAAIWLFSNHAVRPSWLVADFLIIGLIAIQIASEYQAGPFGLLSAVEIVRLWLLPYLVGRCFVGSGGDIRGILPEFAKAALVLCVYAVYESVTHTNPFNELMGKTYGVLEDGQGYRWGLKRAQAFFDHPIYFGFLLVLMLPWALVARQQALRCDAPRWWKWLPVLVGITLACTASRGPVIAGILTVCISGLFPRRHLWVPAARFAAVTVLAILLFQSEVVDGLTRLAGDDASEPVPLVVGNQEVAYTGTSHRLLLFQVYEAALAKLEPLGYGAQLRGVNFDDIPERFRSIDCHYVLFLLQRGPLGLGLFALFALVTLRNLASVALRSSETSARLAAGLFGAMGMVAIMLISVWLSPDFGTFWLFSAGLASGLKSTQPLPLPSTMAQVEWNAPRPKLVAAHAPKRRIPELEECM